MSGLVERGPEWEKMEARLKAEGVTHWHVDRVDGATDEQVATEINKIDAYMKIPENRVASLLRGRAFGLRDTVSCLSRRCKILLSGELEHVEMTAAERAECDRKSTLAALIVEAASLLETVPARITALEAENERLKAALDVELCDAEDEARWANDSDLERCIARRERIAQALGGPHDAD